MWARWDEEAVLSVPKVTVKVTSVSRRRRHSPVRQLQIPQPVISIVVLVQGGAAIMSGDHTIAWNRDDSPAGGVA